MMKQLGTGIILVFLLVILFAFQFRSIEVSDSKLPSLVQKELHHKIEVYKKRLINECLRKARTKAEIYVDSIVAEELRMLGSDTLSFPRKPTRPELPEKLILNDTTPIVPILKR